MRGLLCALSSPLAAALLGAACGDSASDDLGDGDGGSGAGSSGPSGGAPPIDPGCDGDPKVHQGEATFYDFADGSGNCSFPATPNDLMVAAMNHVDYAASAVCGACIEITGPPPESAVIKVRVVDQCPECPEGDVDLSPEAFEQIADLGLGRVPVTWRYAACDVMGPIVYHFKEGSNPYWTAVQIRNHTYAIASLEGQDASGAYVQIPRVDYNFFVAESGLGEGPYAFRVTDVVGHVLEDANVPLVEAGDSPGAGQFPRCE
jgi:expansin (peptidoglycan-binding protein)